MTTTIIVEALIASPPTSKCQETIEVLEKVVQQHPDEVRLIIFKRGIDFVPTDASMAMRCLIQKSSPIPACVINGLFFSSRDVPKLEEVEIRVNEAIKNS